MAFAIGVDIGGSHITAARVDGKSRTMVPFSEVRMDVDATLSASNLISAWSKCIQSVPGYTKNDPIGIAMPGPFDYKNGVSFIQKQHKFQSLFQKPVRTMLAANLQIAPLQIRFENDAVCFLNGEILGGSAHGFNKVLGITLGTGFGSAFYSDGKAWDGELWDAPFRDGNAEQYFATSWFVGEFQRTTNNAISGVKLLAENYPIEAQVLFKTFAKNLFHFLQPHIVHHQIKCLVIGGNISKAKALFVPQLQTHFQEAHVSLEIRISELGEHAALMGAGLSEDKD